MQATTHGRAQRRLGFSRLRACELKSGCGGEANYSLLSVHLGDYRARNSAFRHVRYNHAALFARQAGSHFMLHV